MNNSRENIERRNRGDSKRNRGMETFLELQEEEERKKRRKRPLERERKRKKEKKKPAVGLMHADPAAIMAPAHCFTGLAYWGITGGIACEVLVHGRGLGLISTMFPHLFLHIPSNIPGSGAYCQVYSVCPAWSLESH